MQRHWTFGQKVGAGFGVVVALSIVIGGVAVFALRSVVASKDRVIAVNAQVLVDAERLHASRQASAAAARGFVLTRDDRYLEDLRTSRDAFDEALDRLRLEVPSNDGRAKIDVIRRLGADHTRAIDRVVALRRTDAPLDSIVRTMDAETVPTRTALNAKIEDLVRFERARLEAARDASTATADSAITLVVLLALAIVILAVVVAIVLSRSLARQIGSAVGQVESSSAELHAASSQLATGAREQATAMSEVGTTMSELLATSRQIAESAQRVSQIADQTARGARAGSGTVDSAHESIALIRRQMDLVVAHMLELGKKSQQIGTVLDIVSELAEQTNILAINATIEAAGAGEAGRRFAVVADEIRKLADRVAGTTKEIRTLIEDVRSAVNTTVMATETGSKTVDAGAAQFAQVSTSFKEIAGLVGTTTDAAREIELSTKQQASAVEQVNSAIASVAQATHETEASSGQTQQTAGQLATLSKDLLRLVQPRAAA